MDADFLLVMCGQFLLTVGTVVLGLFVASRVLGIEAGQGAARPKSKQNKGRWGSGRCVLHGGCMTVYGRDPPARTQ